MKMNPLNLVPGTVFICGQASDMQLQSYAEFQKFEDQLKAQGIEFVSMQKIFEDIDTENTFTIDEMMKRCACYLAMCDKVVTLKNWEHCFHAKSLVDVARSLTKKIYPSERFFASLELEKQNATT